MGCCRPCPCLCGLPLHLPTLLQFAFAFANALAVCLCICGIPSPMHVPLPNSTHVVGVVSCLQKEWRQAAHGFQGDQGRASLPNRWTAQVRLMEKVPLPCVLC